MTLRSRLILSFILVVTICLLAASVLTTLVLQRYRDQSMILNMNSMARPIYTQIRELLQGEITISEIWQDIQTQSDENNIYILLVDKNGKILRQAVPKGIDEPLKVSASEIPHSIKNSENGLFTSVTGQKYVYSAYPLIRIIDQSQTIVLCQLRSKIGLIFSGLLVPFLITAIISFIIAIIAAYFLARSIYRPVARLSEAASKISNGNYDTRVDVSGPPEIQGLAHNFNSMAENVKTSRNNLRYFVADVSHQLKSPLTSIQGFAQAINDGTADTEEIRKKSAGIIADESRRMIRQVNQLLELSRLQSGQYRLEKETVNINGLIEHCHDIFSKRFEEKKIAFISDYHEQAVVSGDPDSLEDVFSNLIDNAVKNTPFEGSISVKTESVGQAIVISVEDTGPGIHPEQIPYVFDRFQKAGDLKSGFGLGLSIAKEIIMAHGGTITVSSNPGEGAKFTITLPALSPC